MRSQKAHWLLALISVLSFPYSSQSWDFIKNPFIQIKCNIHAGESQVSQIVFELDKQRELKPQLIAHNAHIETLMNGNYSSYDRWGFEEVSENQLTLKINEVIMNFSVTLEAAPGVDPLGNLVDFAIIESNVSSTLYSSSKLRVNACWGRR